MHFSTCALLAPACSVDLYHQAYLPVLEKKTQNKVDDLRVYNLKDELELDDHVAKVYRKSLLYLVSNAFEREKQNPLLGMEKFKNEVVSVGKLPRFIYSNGVEGQRTRSTSHGGFDNDVYKMNHILRMILGKSPDEPFRGLSLTIRGYAASSQSVGVALALFMLAIHAIGTSSCVLYCRADSNPT